MKLDLENFIHWFNDSRCIPTLVPKRVYVHRRSLSKAARNLYKLVNLQFINQFDVIYARTKI